MVYIGVVGQIAAGKEVFAEYLIKKYGFQVLSLSTVVHQELAKRGITEFNRKTLQDIGDELRKTYGDDVLAKRIIGYLMLDAKNSNVVITGIRNQAEVKYFKTIPGFVLIAIKTKRKIRFKRELKRSKPWDPRSWKDFYKIDRRDFGIGQEKSGQHVGECIKMADYTITNNKDLESFYKKIDKILSRLKDKLFVSAGVGK